MEYVSGSSGVFAFTDYKFNSYRDFKHPPRPTDKNCYFYYLIYMKKIAMCIHDAVFFCFYICFLYTRLHE